MGMSVSPTAFGFQLLLDLYDCRPGVCDDLNQCYQFLDESVPALGMEKQAPPNIFRSDERLFPDKAGLSGWVPLIESSIVIHTLSVKNFISVDVYCCKPFSVDLAKSLCEKFFSPGRIDTQYIERGQDYHKTDSNYHSVTVEHNGTDTPRVVVEPKDIPFASTP